MSHSRIRTRAVEKLRGLLREISSLDEAGSEQFVKWRRDTKVAIGKAFGDGSPYVKDFAEINYTPMILVGGADNTRAYQQALRSGLASASAILRSMLEEVDDYGLIEEGPHVEDEANKASPGLDKVFIVHGRDVGAKDQVARVIDKLGKKPVILADQPSGGSTIIEKFEQICGRRFRGGTAHAR